MSEVFNSWIKLLDSNSFSTLFIDELGWNQPIASQISIRIGDEKYDINPVASFKGIQVWSCNNVPNARIQREIDKEVSKVSAERLTVFYDDYYQNWRWPMSREASGKGTVRLVNHQHIRGEQTLSLLQRLKLISIPVSAVEPSMVEMLLRLRQAFDAEHVTKKFYKEFSGYQKHLVQQIEGLEKLADKEWYSSLLLNRIMFIYFMQWKGFMDGNQNYLGDRLTKIRKLQGPNQFYGFFKDFLLPLFHKGLGAGAKITLPPEIAEIVGRIPYVNGGIFSEHELESLYEINIPDEAFTEIFNFFDTYQWHLDARNTGNRNEINPDVLGYVFEQFVNNKDQGAYYTKEDITDYMTSNTLIINFLKKVDEECQINLLRPVVQNPDRYIWSSLKFGEDVDRTGSANFDLICLPGESKHEFRNRLEHVENLRKQLADGAIASLDELITFNIDLELLASDIIDALDTSEDVVRIWNILSSLKVIDPTCGSGAFLFAALNQLESLYSMLLDVAELHNKTSKNEDLNALLEQVSRHPNRKYFVLKHAAQKNIYGVDIMREATEIARLRLFLKLISAVEKYEDIEPLPDLEFNIKSGNLLIGITKSERLNDYLTTFDAISLISDIETQVTHLADLWENFQLSQDLGYEKAKNAKKILANGTSILRSTLDKLFYEEVVTNRNKESFEDWKESAHPFHWFVEFPDVFQQDGFDVVIGNPPYIKKSKVTYDLKGHYTSDCPDIYAMCMERASLIASATSTYGMIVMSNLVFSERYAKLREYLSQKFPTRWISGYAKRPSLLFEGVQVRNCIFIASNGSRQLYSAPMKRWTKDYRPHLMSNIKYAKVSGEIDKNLTWPFITSQKIADKFASLNGSLKNEVLSKGPNFEIIDGVPVWDKSLGGMSPLFYMGTAYNWISTFTKIPPSEDGSGNPVVSSMLNVLWFKNQTSRDIAFTLFASKWLFAWWAMYSDDFHVTKENLTSFPIDIAKINKVDLKALQKLSSTLTETMTKNIKWQKVTFPDKRVIRVGNWDVSKCREVIDDIDKVWTRILDADELEQEILYQYYSTVKTVSDSSEENSEQDD